MEKIRAKTVVKDKYWILHNKHNKKVGQVHTNGTSYKVRINGKNVGEFNNLAALKKSSLFEFMELPKIKTGPTMDVYGYPTTDKAYNGVWNVESGLPLYTETEDSKSWFAAGFYKLNIKGTWIVQNCPKLITLQRNEYEGPFKVTPGLNNFSRIFS